MLIILNYFINLSMTDVFGTSNLYFYNMDHQVFLIHNSVHAVLKANHSNILNTETEPFFKIGFN